MNHISKEIPTGAIDGTNKEYLLAEPVYKIDDVWVDGEIYKDFSFYGKKLTFDDAPTLSVSVDYWVTPK
jgi:hypothetical protein